MIKYQIADKKYPQHILLYNEIYQKGSINYWKSLDLEIEDYCNKNSIKHINYFYHTKLVKAKTKKK